jgi:hypothetical protein
MCWIAPTEWNRLTIEINPILELHTPFVRRLDAQPGDPPAQVDLDAGQVKAWLAQLRPRCPR